MTSHKKQEQSSLLKTPNPENTSTIQDPEEPFPCCCDENGPFFHCLAGFYCLLGWFRAITVGPFIIIFHLYMSFLLLKSMLWNAADDDNNTVFLASLSMLGVVFAALLVLLAGFGCVSQAWNQGLSKKPCASITTINPEAANMKPHELNREAKRLDGWRTIFISGIVLCVLVLCGVWAGVYYVLLAFYPHIASENLRQEYSLNCMRPGWLILCWTLGNIAVGFADAILIFLILGWPIAESSKYPPPCNGTCGLACGECCDECCGEPTNNRSTTTA